MCHELFSSGAYYRLVPASLRGGKPTDDPVKVAVEGLQKLEGILAHIRHVKRQAAQAQNANATTVDRLYRRFLFYKNFVATKTPLIVTEGKTDPIYLKAAIKKLPDYQSQLGEVADGEFPIKVRFMNFTDTVHEVMRLGNGTGSFSKLIEKYAQDVKQFGHKPLTHPVILIVDNDDGAKGVFNTIKKINGQDISMNSKDAFYRVSLIFI
jgi:RNA-directed DNA polymerase